MRELTDKDIEAAEKTICDNMVGHVTEWSYGLAAPFLFEVEVPISEGKEDALKAFNKLFHAFGVLPKDATISMSEGRAYCATCVGEDGESYCAMFNHPMAMQFKAGDEEYQFTPKARFDADAKAALAEEIEMQKLLAGIESGRLRSKSEDGYLMMMAEHYDEIESGAKKVEYRDFTAYNLKRTIGITSVRIRRGYVKNAPQMRWEVQKVTLMDCDDNECDSFNVPEDFWPATIAIHLGKRID